MERAAESPLRVLHINTQGRLRGGEAQTISLAAGLDARGHHAPLVCQPDSPVLSAARARGLRVIPLRMRADADPAAVLEIARRLRGGRFDALHAHTSHAVGLGALASLLGGRPVRIYTRRLASSILRKSSLRLNRWKYVLGTDACIGISRAVIDQLMKDGIPEDHLALVRSGIDLPEDGAAATRDQLGVPSGVSLIGCVCHLEVEKGVDILIEAMARLAGSGAGPILIIAGDGPEGPSLRARAHRLGLDRRVRFLGHRTDVTPILGALDIYVAASRREALGTSILQAQAHRLAVIAPRVGGIPEVIEDGRTGLLVPPEDPGAFAAAIGRLLRQPALRRRMGRAARERVEREFTTDRMVSGTIEVYRSALGKRRGRDGQ